MHLETPRLVVRTRTSEDVKGVLAYYIRNHNHFACVGPARPVDFYTEAYWTDSIAKAVAEFEAGTGVHMVFVRRESQREIIATASLSQIARKSFLACYLGYGIDAGHEGQGYMTEGLRALIRHAFDERGLHRIMANHLADNVPSARVLDRLGFERGGLAKDYLYISGAWRSHVLTALTNTDPTCVPRV